MAILYAPSLSKRIRRQLSSYGVPIADADIPAFTAWVNDSKTACGNSQFFVIRNPTAKLTLNLRGPVDGSPIRVWNGDGTTSSFSLTTGTDTNVGKVYGSTATRGIVVFGSIKALRSDDSSGQGSDWYANLSGIPLATTVAIGGSTTVTGNLSGIPLATTVAIYGSNTVTGNLSSIPLATYVNIGGSNTVTGNLSDIPLATTVAIGGSTTVTGNLSGIPLATVVNIHGSNTVTGNLSSIPLATYVYISGSNTVTGNLSGIPLATYVNIRGSNTVTGNLSGIPLATYVYIYGSNTVTYNTASGGMTWPASMQQVYLRPDASVFTSAMTDALCIDLAGVVTWTNEKLLDLRGNCGAATAASSAARTTLAGKGVTVYVN